jgi:myosin heavy subunit
VTPKNIECVQLFLGHGKVPGIVSLLAGQCRTGKPDEAVDGDKFVSMLNRQFASNKYFKISTPQTINEVMVKKGLKTKGGAGTLDFKACFEIKHYAGEIAYTVNHFIPKSRDALLPHLGDVLRKSTNDTFASLFSEASESKLTVGEKFKLQLEELAETLQAGETLFVRCIKSNNQKAPQFIDRPMVMDQLIRGGVVAALEMRASGLPDRMNYAAFLHEFGLLERGNSTKKTPKARCEQILEDLLGNDPHAAVLHACGNTKIFMKSGVIAFLRTAARFKTAVFARRMHKKLKSARVRKIVTCWKRVSEAEELAKARGLDNLKLVKSALERGRQKVGVVYEALEAARTKCGGDFDAILKELEKHEAEVKLVTVESLLASDTVERVNTRKREVEQIFSVTIAAAMTQAMELLERITSVETDIADCADIAEPEEIEKCTASCKSARARLEKLRGEDLPALKTAGPEGVDLETDGEAAAAKRREDAQKCAKAETLLNEACKIVDETEGLGVGVLKVRREFAKAVTEVDSERETAQSKLDTLQKPAQECIEEGLTHIVDKIASAVRISGELSHLLRAAKDPDAYRGKVGAFVLAVSDAEKEVEKGKDELARRAAERKMRKQVLGMLDSFAGNLQDGLDQIENERVQTDKLAEDQKHIEDMIAKANNLRQEHSSDLTAWKTSVDALAEQATAVLDQLSAHIEEAREVRREAFKARASVFGNAVGTRAPSMRRSVVVDELVNEADPIAAYIEANGLKQFSDNLEELAETISNLKEEGMQRSTLQQSVKAFMDVSYKLDYKPGSR